MPHRRVLFVARDPGAAGALAPVIRDRKVDTIGLDHARPVFDREGIVMVGPCSDESPEIAVEWLRRLSPDVLVTGTSRLELAARDGAWWSAARSAGIPAVAVLDHWIGYWEKFTVRERFDTLPDVIAVMDDYARRRFLELGYIGPRLVVTGQPAFDVDRVKDPGLRLRSRARWGAGEGDWVVVFASEPTAEDLGEKRKYNEEHALRILLEALTGLPAHLVVKPHPREKPDRLLQVLLSAGRQAIMETHLVAQEAVAGADTVVGMTSIMLLEAALAGRPVLSIQPGLIEPWTLHFSGLMTTVTAVDGAQRWLECEANRAVLSTPARLARARAAGFSAQASANVWRLIGEVVEAAPRESNVTHSPRQ